MERRAAVPDSGPEPLDSTFGAPFDLNLIGL